MVVYGGTNLGHQASQVREGCNILIATPGRLLDFIDRDIVRDGFKNKNVSTMFLHYSFKWIFGGIYFIGGGGGFFFH